MRVNRHHLKKFSWEPLEPCFQLVLAILLGNRQAESQEEETAIKQIRLALFVAASGIFRSSRMKGNDCDPQVAVQEWFISIRAAKHSYQPDRPFYKYAYKVLSNCCRSLGRRAKVRRTQQIPSKALGSTPSPLTLAAQRELRRHLRRALCALKRSGKLSREQHAAIVDKYYRGFSTKEAANRSSARPGTIDSRAHQGRMILRDQFRTAI
jgi:RNA polymerase sigma factor (sigma-70 family)